MLKTKVKVKERKSISYDTIAVIGNGSFGGFFADSMARTEKVKKMILVDYDVIKKKNLRNSIFTENQIGTNKNIALKDMIQSHSNIEVVTIHSEYLEGKTMIPECNLVFDCRDYVYDRYGQIDCRLYISQEYLIIDCRRIMVHDFTYEGNYGSVLKKLDIAHAAIMAAHKVSNKQFLENLIKKQGMESLDLYHRDPENENECDILFDNPSISRIPNLSDNFSTLIRTNEISTIKVYLKSKRHPINKRILKKGIIKTYNDALIELCKALPNDCKNYIIRIEEVKGGKIIILIPESGGA